MRVVCGVWDCTVRQASQLHEQEYQYPPHSHSDQFLEHFICWGGRARTGDVSAVCEHLTRDCLSEHWRRFAFPVSDSKVYQYDCNGIRVIKSF